MADCSPGNYLARLCALEDYVYSQNPVTDERLCLALVADVGEPGAAQTAVVNTVTAMAPDFVLDAGDNNYLGGDPAAWAGFLPWINARTYFRVRGNHSLDTATEINNDAAVFGVYLGTGMDPWWSRSLGNGLVDIFGIETGKKTNGTFIAGGLQIAGGAQYLWLKDKLQKSTAKHKLVMFHHSPVSTGGDPGHDVTPEMDWDILAYADAVLQGHTHINEWIVWRGTPFIKFANAVRTDGDSLARTVPAGAVPVYANDTDPLVGRLWVTQDDVMIEGINTSTGEIDFARSIYDKSPRAFRLQKWIFDTEDFVVTSGVITVELGRVSAPVRILSVEISTGNSAGTGVGGKTVKVTASGGLNVTGSVALATSRISGNDLNDVWIPQGSMFRAEVLGWPDYTGSPAQGLMVEIFGHTLG